MTVEEVRKHEVDFEEWFVKVGYMLTYPNAEHTVDVNHDMKVAMLSSYLKGIEEGHKQGELVRNTAQYKDIQQYKNALLCEQQLNIDLQKENEKLKEELEELKSQLYRSEKNVFAELNQETADSNAYLIDEVATLQEQIEKMKCCANCKNCTSFDDISGLRIFECKEKTVSADSVCENWEGL